MQQGWSEGHGPDRMQQTPPTTRPATWGARVSFDMALLLCPCDAPTLLDTFHYPGIICLIATHEVAGLIALYLALSLICVGEWFNISE